MKPAIAFFAALLFTSALAQPVPAVDSAAALSGAALVQALRGGGFVLLMRHAQQGKRSEQCGEQDPGLTAEGEAQARKTGAAIRELRIPIGKVRTSRLCRAVETGRFLELGPLETTPDLNPGTRVDTEIHTARERLLAEFPKAGTNTLLVSHAHNSARDDQRVTYQLAEIIVFRPSGPGSATPVARIRLEDWDALPK